MKITKRQLRRIIREAHWGGFTGGAAPLDEPPLDSGMMEPDQQQKVFDILVDTGSDPKKLLASGEFPDVVTEIKLNERGSGNPALRAEEQSITRSVADFVDKYMMTMGLNPGSDADMKKARLVVDDVVTAVMDVL